MHFQSRALEFQILLWEFTPGLYANVRTVTRSGYPPCNLSNSLPGLLNGLWESSHLADIAQWDIHVGILQYGPCIPDVVFASEGVACHTHQ